MEATPYTADREADALARAEQLEDRAALCEQRARDHQRASAQADQRDWHDDLIARYREMAAQYRALAAHQRTTARARSANTRG